MKQNQIFLIIGIIALLLLVFNWNKIFPSKMRGGNVVYRGGGRSRAGACDPPCDHNTCPNGYCSGCSCITAEQ